MKTTISYHPISEKEIHDWYIDMNFSLISDDINYTMIKTARAEKMDDESLKKYIKTMKKAVKTDANAVFDTTHGFFIAKIQTYFRQSFTVDAIFSDLIKENEKYLGYTKTWQSIIEPKNSFSFLNTLSPTKSSGIYIPAEKVVKLLKDYEVNLLVKKDFIRFFDKEKLSQFIDALHFAKDNNLGLLEANGVLKYEEEEKASSNNEIIELGKEEPVSNEEKREKKSIFSRVFGKK